MFDEAIAIAGIACRCPDVPDLQWLWDLVMAGRRAFRRIPPTRLYGDCHNGELVGGIAAGLNPSGLISFAHANGLGQDDRRGYNAPAAGFPLGEDGGIVALMRTGNAHAARIPGYADLAGFAALAALCANAPQAAALDSTRAGIGQIMAAVGLARQLRAVLAMAPGMLPPTTGSQQHPASLRATSTVRARRRPKPWPGPPRVADVAAMGFGGANAHVVLSRVGGLRGRPARAVPAKAVAAMGAELADSDGNGAAASGRAVSSGSTVSGGIQGSPCAEVYAFSGDDPTVLAATFSQIAAIAARLSDGERGDLACLQASNVATAGRLRVAFAAATAAELARRAGSAAKLVTTLSPGLLQHEDGVFAGDSVRGRIVLLFTGQDPAAMLVGSAAGRTRAGDGGEPALATPPHATATRQAAVCQGAPLALRWLDQIGVTATAAVGHDLGEIAALVWAGCLAEADAARLVAERARAVSGNAISGTAMLGLAADVGTARALSADTDLVMASYDGPQAQVLAGAVAAIHIVAERAVREGITATLLPPSRPFHHATIARCAAALRPVLESITIGPPRRRLISTIAGRELRPRDDIAALLSEQLSGPVRFHEAVRAAAPCADLFCETGPGRMLAGFAAQCCRVPAVSIEAPGGGTGLSDAATADAAAALFASGAAGSLEALFNGHVARPVSIWRERLFISTPPRKDGTAPPPPSVLSAESSAASSASQSASAADPVRPIKHATGGPYPPPARGPWRIRVIGRQPFGKIIREASADDPSTGGSGRLAASCRFLEKVRVHDPGVELVTDATLGPETDPYLADYRFEGRAVLPVVLGLEAMAQAAAVLAGQPLRQTTDVRLTSQVALAEDGTAQIRISALRLGDVVETVLRSAVDEYQTDHIRAFFPVACATPASASPGAVPAGVADGGLLDELSTGIVDGAELYGPLCGHTGRFRRVAFLPSLTPRSCRALVRGADHLPWFGPCVADGPLLLGSPAVNDAAIHVLQACVPHRRLVPAGCESVTASGHAVTGAVEVRACERRASKGEYVWDVDAVDSDGRTVVAWAGLRLTDAGPRPRTQPWSPALLAAYLERCAAALHLGPGLRVTVRAGHPRAPSGGWASDGGRGGNAASLASTLLYERPERARRARRSHLDGLTLAVDASAAAACDWQPAGLRHDPPLPRSPDCAALHNELRERCGEPSATVAARIWTVVECMSKAGLPAGLPLALDAVHDDGWAVLRAGDAVLASTVVAVSGVTGPLAVALMTVAGHQDDAECARGPSHGGCGGKQSPTT
ncbi:MAG TPA: acyltransferase domain-containing protein [Streptosporangiaceae bacterium]|nr:acyltransferase domain-containing protein [Streptosporangiaceae bacterium]